MARRRNTQAVSAVAPVEPSPGVPQPEAAPLFAEPVAPAVPTPAPAPTKWRVEREVRVSWYGHLTTIPAGSIVSVSEYGPDGINRLRDQNVQLVPVE